MTVKSAKNSDDIPFFSGVKSLTQLSKRIVMKPVNRIAADIIAQKRVKMEKEGVVPTSNDYKTIALSYAKKKYRDKLTKTQKLTFQLLELLEKITPLLSSMGVEKSVSVDRLGIEKFCQVIDTVEHKIYQAKQLFLAKSVSAMVVLKFRIHQLIERDYPQYSTRNVEENWDKMTTILKKLVSIKKLEELIPKHFLANYFKSISFFADLLLVGGVEISPTFQNLFESYNKGKFCEQPLPVFVGVDHLSSLESYAFAVALLESCQKHAAGDLNHPFLDFLVITKGVQAGAVAATPQSRFFWTHLLRSSPINRDSEIKEKLRKNGATVRADIGKMSDENKATFERVGKQAILVFLQGTYSFVTELKKLDKSGGFDHPNFDFNPSFIKKAFEKKAPVQLVLPVQIKHHQAFCVQTKIIFGDTLYPSGEETEKEFVDRTVRAMKSFSIQTYSQARRIVDNTVLELQASTNETKQ